MERLAFLKAFAKQRGLDFKTHSQPGGLIDYHVYSRDMKYRYAFARCWNTDGPLILWVGVNPGKGDTELRRRPTVERCLRWSRSWNAAGLMFANLFAVRHNKPTGLRGVTDPVGPHNDDALREMSAVAARTVAAWGNAGRLHNRFAEVAVLLSNPICLGVTKRGQPRHPLYVPDGTSPVCWRDVKTSLSNRSF